MSRIHFQRAETVAPLVNLLRVFRGGLLLGWVVQESATAPYRYFPGADNQVAFVFEHDDLATLYRMIETRDWIAELAPVHFHGRAVSLEDVWGERYHTLKPLLGDAKAACRDGFQREGSAPPFAPATAAVD